MVYLCTGHSLGSGQESSTSLELPRIHSYGRRVVHKTARWRIGEYLVATVGRYAESREEIKSRCESDSLEGIERNNMNL